MQRLIVYNPYSILDLYKLIIHYRTLKNTFGKAELLKKIIPKKAFLYLRKMKILKSEATKPALFKHVEIETINRCNNICSFCPVNRNYDIRPYKEMSEVLYKSIIDQLAELNYSGEITFHSNNEPLLDKNLAVKIEYARNKCPHAFIYFYTNGKLLTIDKITEFSKAGIDKIVINNYSLNRKLNNNIKVLIDEIGKTKMGKLPKIVIIIRKLDEVLNNRAGNSPNKPFNLYEDYKTYQNLPCNLPFDQFIIRPDGKVSLCCQDAYGETTLGNVNESSILDIWNNDSFESYRKKLTNSGRKGLPLCEKCDA